MDRTVEPFDDDVNQIKQGNLGNCWALAALVSYLNLNPLSSILRKHENITAGGKKCKYYKVRLDGKWIPADTLAPENADGKPLFGQGKVATVFEKALANWVNEDATYDPIKGDGYGPLGGGYAEEALELLSPTGDHYIQVHSKDFTGVKLAKMLLYGFQFSMTASWDGHAQSVMDVVTEARNRHEVSDINTFVRIRDQVSGKFRRMSVQEYKRTNIRTGIAFRAFNRNYDNDGIWRARYEEYQTHHNGWLKEQAVRKETNKRVRQANVARETYVNHETQQKCSKHDNMTYIFNQMKNSNKKRARHHQNHKSRGNKRGN